MSRLWTSNEVKILKKKYPRQGTTIPELDRTRSAIRAKAFKIKLSYEREKHIQMTDQLRDFLNGLLLGDGSIQNNSRGTAYYRHGDNYKEYLIWLKEQLELLGLSCNKIYKYEYNSIFHFYSQRAKELEDLYHEWYPNNKKRIPSDLTITPTILKNWFIGDGSCYELSNHNTFQLIIHCLFDPNGKSRMVDQINQGTPIKAHNIKRGIYFPVDSHEDFFNYILQDEKTIPPGYEYKFPGRYL